MTASPPYRGRFAPSPTGPLHFGSLLAAFGSWLLARHHGGEWLIRIEDIDPPREVAGAAMEQLATLAAFGLESDQPVTWQGERGHLYRQALERLLASGHAFPCHCSRGDLGANGGVHRHCVASRERPDPSIRLRVAADSRVVFEDGLQGQVAQDVGSEVGDFVLKRADGCWAYQLAVVVDDAAQGITHVVRGADLLDSTPRQILLQRALGLPVPRYLHLPVITDDTGHKLSKSARALPVDRDDPVPALRAAWRALGQPAGSLPGCTDMPALLDGAASAFDPALLPAVPAIAAAALHNSDDANAV